MALQFRLKDFDGPLDLLLTLINKAQLDIRDIFISEITDQYIAIVRDAPDLDMDEATEFLVMAATLMEIKSRSMLPKPPSLEEGETDPEAELIQRLEEYKRFRELSADMKQFELSASRLFAKLPEEYPLPPQEVELTGLTLDGLTAALMRILSRKPPAEEAETNHYAARSIHRDEHTVQECMLTFLRRLKKDGSMRFDEAFSDAPNREEVVTRFLALLELLRLGRIHARQECSYGDILLLNGPAPVEGEEA